MKKRPSRRELRENPPAAERAAIERSIRLLPLCRRGVPGEIDWPAIASRLASELAAAIGRLSSDPAATEADVERAARSAAVLKDFRAAAAAELDLESRAEGRTKSAPGGSDAMAERP